MSLFCYYEETTSRKVPWKKTLNWGLASCFRVYYHHGWVRDSRQAPCWRSEWDPHSDLQAEIWVCHGLLKPQSPSPGTYFLQQVHNFYSFQIMPRPGEYAFKLIKKKKKEKKASGVHFYPNHHTLCVSWLWFCKLLLVSAVCLVDTKGDNLRSQVQENFQKGMPSKQRNPKT